MGLRAGIQDTGPYLLGGREAGKGTEVGVCDQHGLRKQACVCVLGHLRLVAVEGWEERTQIWLKTEHLWEVGMGPDVTVMGWCLGIQIGETDPLSSHYRGLLS